MTFWETNGKVLHQRHPELARHLKALPERAPQGDWSPSKRGPLSVRRDGTSWASRFDPVEEARRAVPNWGPEVAFAVFPSWGAAYHVEAVAERYPDLPLVVADPDLEWFAEVLQHRDLTVLLNNDRLEILGGPAAQNLSAWLEQYWCDRVEVLSWRPAAARNPEWDQKVNDMIGRAQARVGVNLATFARFGDLWRRNLIRNEADASAIRPLEALSQTWKGRPALVAAAGPSLADALPWMSRNRNTFGLIAVDTAWPALSAHGFEPDLLLVLDAQYWNARHLDPPLPARTAVVTEWTAPPRAFTVAPGRTFVAATSLPFLRKRETRRWGVLGDLPSGGSVGTAAWSLAVHLGCSEVVFAGLDLGFPRGQSHIPGSQFEEALHRQSSKLRPAETRGLSLGRGPGLSQRPAFDGTTVASDARMDLFRAWLEAAIARHPGVAVWTLGSRGSLIQGVRLLDEHAPLPWSLWSPTLPRCKAIQSSDRNAPNANLSILRLFCQSLDESLLSEVWRVAQEVWGDTVWSSWTGRAYHSWVRFPSARSLRALGTVVEAALAWERFGT